MVESLGADKYVYFTAEGAARALRPAVRAAELEAESGSAEHEFVARVPAASKAVEGRHPRIGLRRDAELAVFDPQTGVNLTDRPGARPVTQPLDRVRAAPRHGTSTRAEPDVASVTFLGAEPIDVLRYRARCDTG